MGLFDVFKKKEILEPVSAADSDIVAPADGELIDVTTVSDAMFAKKMLGESVAFRYTADKVTFCAPANGELTTVFPTGHAYGMTMKDGTEILIHIGIDTVNAKGEGFRLCGIKQGQSVTAGTPIVVANMKKLSAMYDMPVMLIITNTDEHPVTFISPSAVTRGQKINL